MKKINCTLNTAPAGKTKPCSTLQNVLRKVQHQDALQISDVVMASLLRMFQSTAGSGGVQEDALMAVSTLVEGRCSLIVFWGHSL